MQLGCVVERWHFAQRVLNIDETVAIIAVVGQDCLGGVHEAAQNLKAIHERIPDRRRQLAEDKFVRDRLHGGHDGRKLGHNRTGILAGLQPLEQKRN